jgi:phosphoglycerol transferase MdoB-like AlkP superfamily enzyme
MSKRYGYKQLLEPASNEEWQDTDVLNASSEAIDNATSKFCVMGITVSMHSPFTRVSNPLDLSSHTPDLLQKYMECVNYTDKCIEHFVSCQLNDSVRKNTTIVITSDHTIFKPAMLPDFMDYAIEQDLSIASGENYCPLIIYSPQIEGNVQINELCYQMDIFPTILHLIGCEDYYWKGFGVNLLDSVARNNRPITEQEAYILSDKIIRANWFESYTH